jgi:hypothetical protein
MIFPFVSHGQVLSSLTRYNERNLVLAIVGTQDKLVSISIMRRLVHLYAATKVVTYVGGTTTKRFGFKDVSRIQDSFMSGITQSSEDYERV